MNHTDSDLGLDIFERLLALLPDDKLDALIGLRREAPGAWAELFGVRPDPAKMRRIANHANAFGVRLATVTVANRKMTTRRAILDYVASTERARRAAEAAVTPRSERRARTEAVLAEHGLAEVSS